MTVPSLTLNDGHSIPQLGFGVFLVPPDETAETVTSALEIGYRHIDTAQMYGNEKGVGEALAASGIERDELFITTKLGNPNHKPDDVRRTFDQSLTDLGLDHVDLFLIHWPLPTQYDGDFVSTWKAMTELTSDGRAKSVGVSNFEPDHLAKIIDESGVLPAVNQIEVHPQFANTAARTAGLDRGILTEAWSPIGRGAVLDDPIIGEIATRLGKTPAQVTLRWHIERGDIIFPKSMHVSRMQENFEIFDFSLTPDDVNAISALDRGDEGRIGPDPKVFDRI
ncbi:MULTISPECIES: aldo/keto reductase [unclassified Nocardioides]|uniref:aldo/keto reductase n=1 Tax=unclassified Nocardioides TaxID=2615069 RepID=UPI0006F6F5C3|nr:MULTISPECIES: aldo/keto reductase [unclassified Nocardioides]KQY57069.1 oxidoreductase [Nocardioides sp. Root140]KRF11709.1 oxidoreductase [Nocardioides sp. Soil796]